MLLTVTVAEPKRFTLQKMPVIYTEVFVELYNWRNCGQVYKIYRIIEHEKICALTTKNPYNFGAH